MIDVFYVLGSGSKWDNNEIRYSLRSLEKYGKNVGQVWVVGNNPGFLSKEVKHIKAPDIGSPACNHWYKVKKFFTETNIDKALYMMDDIFFTKETDLENYPYYYNRDLPTCPITDPDRYHHTLRNTRNELSKLNKPIISFGVHCPIIYEKDKFLNLNKLFTKFKNRYIDFIEVRSLYCNMNDIKGEYCTDVKLREKYMDNWKELIYKNDCFSISDEVIKIGIGDWLKENYPNPSKYEKTPQK